MFRKEIYFVLPRWRRHKQGDIESKRWEGDTGAKTNKAFEADLTPV